MHLDRTSQLNFGGNTDFYNMLERERLVSKKISKTDAVRSQLGHDLPAEAVHIGPSDYVPWLADRKWAHIRLEGRGFGDQPINVELKLEVWDSPELRRGGHRRRPGVQAGPRSRDQGRPSGTLGLPDEVPARAVADDAARQRLERFIAGEE